MKRQNCMLLLHIFYYIELNCSMLLISLSSWKPLQLQVGFFPTRAGNILRLCLLLLCCCRMFVRVWPDLKASCCCSFLSVFFNLVHILLQPSCTKQQNKPTNKQVFFHCWWSCDQVTQVTETRSNSASTVTKTRIMMVSVHVNGTIFRRVQTLTWEPNWR